MLQEALTFDDVLLKPASSNILPSQTSVQTNITKNITLGIPLLSAAMDTVTESSLAIALGQLGGIGVLHRNMEIDKQVAEIRKVKKFESGMVVNPLTLYPNDLVSDALHLMAENQISSIPITQPDTNKLLGILTNRDVRFASNPNQPVSELMTKDNLITTNETVSHQQAKKLLHQNRIEKLIVVDKDYRCVGLITVKDIEKSASSPQRNKR